MSEDKNIQNFNDLKKLNENENKLDLSNEKLNNKYQNNPKIFLDFPEVSNDFIMLLFSFIFDENLKICENILNI